DPRPVRTSGQPVLRHRAPVGRRHHRPCGHPHRARPRAGRVLPHPAARARLRPVPDVSAMAFHTVLVANRGEIAVRIIATLRALGIRSVAVYSDADDGAPHVATADVAVRLGPARASESYLDIAQIIAAARATGAQAVHPGYGFASESPTLARACAEAGLVFIGPPAAALEAMGDKIRAKEIARTAGVPVIDGVAEAPSSRSVGGDAALVEGCAPLGFPVLVKPSAGGGGKGMVRADDATALPEAIASARRVAAAAFGDDTLLVERFVPAPRHIEVQ